MAIRKVAVIGAGLMGSGIAAHLANAGVDVLLLDLQKSFADAGVTRQLKAGGFMDPAFAARITTGSTPDDLGLVSDADWIIEAIAERLELKQALYAALDAVRKPGSLVSSNTSTIQIAALTAGQSDSFAGDFLITHFFNPPRQMRLLEIVAGPGTRPEAVSIIRDFGDRRLGKDVVLCRDTPGFIANRIGSYWMAAAMNEAIRLGLDVEEADLVLGKPFGIPSTGIFGLLDLVGIDLMPMVLRSLQAAVPKDDAIHDHDAEPGLIARMIAEGRIGRKSGAGFVRLSSDRKSRAVTDLATGAYRPQRPARSEIRPCRRAASMTISQPKPCAQPPASRDRKGLSPAERMSREQPANPAGRIDEVPRQIFKLRYFLKIIQTESPRGIPAPDGLQRGVPFRFGPDLAAKTVQRGLIRIAPCEPRAEMAGRR